MSWHTAERIPRILLAATAISLELGSRGTGHYETLMAIPIDEFIAAL